MKLSHVAFRTQHTDETYKFYTEALGLEEHFRLYNGDGSLWIIYLKDKDGQFIELFTGGTNESESEDRRMRSFQHICMLVDDLESEARRLQDMGIDVYLGPTWLGSKYDVPYSSTFVGKCGSTAIYVRDPEGNEVEIMQ